jgi:hypothetical protein
MTTIFQRVETALATLDPAVPFAMSPYSGTLPALYIAHQLVDSPPEQHADDAEILRSYTVQVTIWSTAGLAVLPNVDAAMKAAGFEKGRERQLPKDQISGHYGLAKEFIYLE